MKSQQTIKRSGLRKKFFGSRAYLRSVKRKAENSIKPINNSRK